VSPDTVDYTYRIPKGMAIKIQVGLWLIKLGAWIWHRSVGSSGKWELEIREVHDKSFPFTTHVATATTYMPTEKEGE